MPCPSLCAGSRKLFPKVFAQLNRKSIFSESNFANPESFTLLSPGFAPARGNVLNGFEFEIQSAVAAE